MTPARPAMTAARPAMTVPQPPPPVEAAPAGVVVGTPEPEPDNFRTVQMAPVDLAALGVDPATLPPIARPTTTAKKTIIGMPAVVLPGKLPATTPAPLQAPMPNLGMMATAEMQAPKLPSPTSPVARVAATQ